MATALTRDTIQLQAKCVVLPLVCRNSFGHFPTLVVVKILPVLLEASRATGKVRRLARLWIFGDLPKADVEEIFSDTFAMSG